jgi:hypothetical protein
MRSYRIHGQKSSRSSLTWTPIQNSLHFIEMISLHVTQSLSMQLPRTAIMPSAAEFQKRGLQVIVVMITQGVKGRQILSLVMPKFPNK